MTSVEAANVGSHVKANHNDSTFYHDEYHATPPDVQFDTSSHDLENGDLKEANAASPPLDALDEAEYVVTAKTWAVVVVRRSISLV